MTEFNQALSQAQQDYLAANKADLCKTAGGKLIWQNRIKMASEAYQVAKSIAADNTLTTLVERNAEDEEDDHDETILDWQTYRDNFILDWIANRTVVTQEEADAMIERDIDQALQAAELTEDAEVVEVVEDAPIAVVAPTPSPEPIVVVVKKKSYYKPKTKAVAKTVKAKAPKKAAAKKKTVSASDKAQVIIERYVARNWTRKSIIEKLQDQLDMGAAYASTLYQKFS
jgi:hypothetical protein